MTRLRHIAEVSAVKRYVWTMCWAANSDHGERRASRWAGRRTGEGPGEWTSNSLVKSFGSFVGVLST